jgi:hypothetical protein
MSSIDRRSQRLFALVTNGATQSEWVMMRGYALGEITFPVGYKGNIKYRVKHAATHDGGFAYTDDVVATAVKNTLTALVKPLTLAIKPTVMNAAFFQVVAASAQTASKWLDIHVKG